MRLCLSRTHFAPPSNERPDHDPQLPARSMRLYHRPGCSRNRLRHLEVLVTERSSPDIADLAEWAEAAAGLFPAHGDKYKQISEILRASLQPASPTAAVKCDVCNGEGRVAYIQSAGGFSEPADCYKCNGTGKLATASDAVAGDAKFEQWAKVWHQTCETMVTLLGLPGCGSPQELLAQVQTYAEQVGKYRADYSPLTTEEIQAEAPGVEELYANSRPALRSDAAGGGSAAATPSEPVDPLMTPKEFMDSILSACDASNWDADRNKGGYYRGLHDAYEAVQEIAIEYQTAMYEWTRRGGVAQPVAATLKGAVEPRTGAGSLD
jgi:hypothetical protein